MINNVHCLSLFVIVCKGLTKKLVSTNDVAAQLIAQGEDLKAQQPSELVIPSHTIRQCVKSAKVMLDLKKLRLVLYIFPLLLFSDLSHCTFVYLYFV